MDENQHTPEQDVGKKMSFFESNNSDPNEFLKSKICVQYNFLKIM